MFELILKLFGELLFLAGYIGGGNAFPKALSKKDEEKYIELYKKGDVDAKNTLIEHNLRLVAHIAKKYSNESNADDLISVGIIGLIKGINTFDEKKNHKLVTYVSRCIENEVLMSLRSAKKYQNEVSLEECIGVDKEGNNLTLADILPSESIDIVEELAKGVNIERLYDAVENDLTRLEKDIIVYRYGLYNTKKLPQREVAKKFNISRSYVSRIEKRAIKKLGMRLKKEE